MNQQRPNAVFSKTAPYYDVIYGGRNVKRDARIIISHLSQSFSHTKHPRLLDLGCGTGAHDIEFWRHGYNVTGIDKSAAMIAEAKRKATSAHAEISYITLDFLSYAPAVRYDAAVSLFDVLSYMTTNAQVTKYFSAVSALLKPRGVFMFDCWYGPGVLLSKPGIIRQSYRSSDVTVARVKTPIVSYETNTVTVRHTLNIQKAGKKTGRFREDHVLRYFFYPEIEQYAQQAGFTITSWGLLDFPLRKAPQESWSVFFVAQKTR